MPRRRGIYRDLRILPWLAGLLLIVASVAACSSRTRASQYRGMFRDSFEAGLDGWQTAANVPEDGERPGPAARSIKTSDLQASDGHSSVQFSLDGEHDGGTIWLVRPFNVPANRDLIVRLSFDARSEAESFNTTGKVAAYAGAQKPRQEGDFDLSQALDQATGWNRYSYSVDVQSGSNGQLWIAVGITAVWETKLTYYFDNLLMEIEARQ